MNLHNTRRRLGSCAICLTYTVCSCLLQCARGAENVSKQAPSTTAEGLYILAPDDQLSIWVLGIAEILPQPVRIDPNGNLDLPMLGSIHAAGKTLSELRSELLKRSSEYVREPRVTVTIIEFKSQPVSVIGAVKTPGVHQIAGCKNLIEVLSMAGGILPDAGNKIAITRAVTSGRIPLSTAKDDATGQFNVAEVNVKTLLQANRPADNVLVCPHDTVSVPQASLIYVMGEVNKPGGYPLAERTSYSVLQALSIAGGTTRSAAPQHAEILRSPEGGTKREALPLNVARILSGKASDVPLQPDDILFVPNNVAKSASLRAVEAAIQVGTGVLIWR